jgi:hypothetical protein
MELYMHVHDSELLKKNPIYPVIFTGNITIHVPAKDSTEAINLARAKMKEVLEEQFGKDAYAEFLYIRSRR